MIKDFFKILKEGTSYSRKDWFAAGDYKRLSNEVGGLNYYRGLNQYQTNKEKGYLIDTCLNAQDQYTGMIKYYIGNK